jgi:hypothetical protein
MLLACADGSGSVDKSEFHSWLKSPVAISVLSDDSKYKVLCSAINLFDQYDSGN